MQLRECSPSITMHFPFSFASLSFALPAPFHRQCSRCCSSFSLTFAGALFVLLLIVNALARSITTSRRSTTPRLAVMGLVLWPHLRQKCEGSTTSATNFLNAASCSSDWLFHWCISQSSIAPK